MAQPSETGFELIPLLRAVLPKVPTVGKTIASHTLGISPTSSKWDLRTEVTVAVLRSFISGKPQPITRTQKILAKVPPIKGKIWVAKTSAPVPSEDDVRQKLFTAIEEMGIYDPSGPPTKSPEYVRPELVSVEAEWTGYRSGATKSQPQLRASEETKYKEMMKDVSSKTTIMYMHGGAYYLMDPATHRPTVQKLCQLTKGRAYNIRYRLAPQHPFPAALLDAFVSYLTLLAPPAGTFHEAVAPEHIVFAGDSAGGNLSTVLIVLLLHLRKTETKITWNGKEMEVPLPAGIATNSPWLDITHSSPSCDKNGKWDYLPTRSMHPNGMTFPSDSVWPPKAPYPERRTVYADDAFLTHPLVSPLGLSVESWKQLGIGEVNLKWFMCFGDELLQDEDRFVAGQLVRAGAEISVYEYEAMPHCFAMVFEGTEGSRHCFGKWAAAIDRMVNGSKEEGKRTGGYRVGVKTLKEVEVDIEKLTERTEVDVRGGMLDALKSLGREDGEAEDPLSKL